MKTTSPRLELADHYAELKSLLAAVKSECESGLLRADSSQSQFNATRVYLRGRMEAVDAFHAYLDGNYKPLEDLARP